MNLGILCAGGAFLFWGLVPVYWKLLSATPALEILAHRVIWALVFSALWISWRRRWNDLIWVFRRPRTALALLASTLFIGVNWGLFIWAVNSDRVLSTSLGYFINPLVNVVLGMVVLGERLNAFQWTAVALAVVAVSNLTISLGTLPWVSLALAGAFGMYGLVRKIVQVDVVIGLVFETAILSVIGVVWLIWREIEGVASLGHKGLAYDALLVSAGLVTAVPLIIFTHGVRRIPLSMAGLLQYIAPSCTFVLAVFVYGEAFSSAQGFSFMLIWIGLAIYTYDLVARSRASRS